MTTYEELRQAAESGKREDINALGRWFEREGSAFWNGEYYDADGMELYPVYKLVDAECGDYEIVGYTTDKQESMDSMNEPEEITLKISRIAIKTEVFCTPWNGNLYCVDITEDAEERGAWLYRSNCGVKNFMFGYQVKDMSADEFKDLVFSNLPEYIDIYEEEVQ